MCPQATMQGSYFLLKVNLIISMWILQPLHRLFCWVMLQLKMQHYIPAPKGGSQDDSAAQAALERAAKQELHPATIEIERRTHARWVERVACCGAERSAAYHTRPGCDKAAV
jgi:hypothetical protein